MAHLKLIGNESLFKIMEPATILGLGAVFIVGLIVGVALYTFLDKKEKNAERSIHKPAPIPPDPLEKEAREHLKGIN